MKGQHWKRTTISVYLRTLRALAGYARKEKIVAKTFNPFSVEDGFTLKGYNRIDTSKRSIALEDVQKLADVPTTPGSKEYHAQQLFLFSYYCRGINFIDVAYLTRANVVRMSNGTFRMRYNRHKTGHDFDRELLAPALGIWDYYLNHQSQGSKYV